MKTYLLNLLVWVSQTINVIFLLGHPDQTVSARAYMNRDKPVWSQVYQGCNLLFFWQVNHCYTSYYEDIDRASVLLSYERL